ncbi:MAG: hypothetical protein M1830_002172 [Pleopsidium flavum]|nr:MAG: hypothetical protein M1830_002172 [Pleopsidium flavum]
MPNHLPDNQLNGDYSEDEIPDDGGDDEPELDDQVDQDELMSGHYALGLNKSYVPSWEGKEAFREFYQNWKDGIIDSFDLEPRSFKPFYEETESKILITVDRANTRPAIPQHHQLLGFIRFNKKAGSLEFANFKAGLSRRNLDLGNTTKRKKGNQAGTHGEGFKIASLVMCRKEHSVRYSTSSCYLNFCFPRNNKETLWCKVTKPSSKALQKQQDAYNKSAASGQPRAPKANMWEDVSLVIGKGPKGSGVEVALKEFHIWLQVTIDVKPPSDVLETDFGDLILDESFAGKVYLKGLLLPNASSSAKKFVYGYNLRQGCTNRDRGRLTDPSEEANQLRSIWEQAVDKRDELVDKYVNLLQHHQDCGDISLAESKVRKATAEKIWANLFSKVDGERFYFREGDDNHVRLSTKSDFQSIELIRSSLQRSPVPLPKGLWKILTRFKLVRTPQEERLHLFTKSAPSVCQTSSFSENVQRALRAALALNERTSDVTVLFVEGGQVGMDLLYESEKKTVKVHEKWLNFEEIHKTATCHLSRLATTQSVASEVLFCDHIIEEIYGMTLSEILKCLGLRQNAANVIERSLRNEVRDKLQQMPRGISVTSTQVSDPQQMSPQNNQRRGLSDQTTAPCGCYEQVTPLKVEGVTFRGLDPLQEYFVMIAPLGKWTMFGRPSPPTRPKPLESASAAAISSAVPDNVKLTRPISSPCAGGYDSDHTDDSLYREPTPIAPKGTPSNRPKSAGKESSIDAFQPFASGGRARPDLTARRSLNTALNRGNGGDTESSNIEQQLDGQEGNDGAQERLEQDREAKHWKTWEETNMNDSFALFNPKGLPKPLANIAPYPCAKHYADQRLRYLFEEGEFVHVEIRSLDLWGESSISILKVHGIICPEPDEVETGYRLLVSRYSFLATSPLHRICATVGEAKAAEKELVLHFDNFDWMGQKLDAELLPIDKIHCAKRLNVDSEGPLDPVMHVIRAPEGQFVARFMEYPPPISQLPSIILSD